MSVTQPEYSDEREFKGADQPEEYYRLPSPPTMNMLAKFNAEFFGTCFLVLIGCGSICFPVPPSFLTISFAFGLATIALTYAIGPTSGCHINPAVSLGVWCAGRMKGADMLIYWLAQFLGGIAGALLLWLIAVGRKGYMHHPKYLGANCWGHECLNHYNLSSSFFAELIFTFLFLINFLGSRLKEPKETGSKEMVPQQTASGAGLSNGITYTAIMLAGMPITGVSMNPARSFGPAIIVGGLRLTQVWLFFIAPFLGAAIAGFIWRCSCPMGKGWLSDCIPVKRFCAEFVGTYTLVLLGVGTAVFSPKPERLNIAVAFGFSLIAMAYGIGSVSGCHINPAVSLGVWISGSKPFTWRNLLTYWFAQFLGAMLAAACVFGIVQGRPGYTIIKFGLGTNSWGKGSYDEYNTAAAFFAELIFTCIFLFSILGSTAEHNGVQTYLSNFSIGITLMAIHIISIPITGTSVNPARSFGPALFVGGKALGQCWLFFLGPLLGGAMAGAVYRINTKFMK